MILYKKFTVPNKQAHKPVLISGQKWNQITDHLTGKKFLKSAIEKEYYEYMKSGSKNMKKNWTNPPKIQILKSSSNDQEQIKQDLTDIERKEKIEKANNMIQKPIIKFRELESAALSCEILKGRLAQIEFNKNMKNRAKEEKIRENEELKNQAIPYIQELQNIMLREHKQKERFKADLLENIKKNNEKHSEYTQLKLEGERRMFDLMKEGVQMQENEQNNTKNMRKSIFKKQILEDMLHKKAKCNRMKIEDQIQDKLNSTYMENEEKKKFMSNVKKRQQISQQKSFIEKNAKRTFDNIIDVRPFEELSRLKKVMEEEEKFQIQLKEKLDKQKLLRDDRNQKHQEYLKCKQQNAEKQNEIYKLDMERRLKNCEVYENYLQQEKLMKIKKHKETEETLKNQINNQKAAQINEKETDIKGNSVNFDLQDEFFLNYANNLIEIAKYNNRPCFPLQKLVAAYKKQHELDRKIIIPPHLRTTI